MTKVPKALSWMLVLATLAALLPWHAALPRRAHATITTPFQVRPEPPTAGASASYIVLFKSNVALVANQTTIRITFPSDTFVPSSISR
ncbi:MAG: hypothetical protein RMK40_08195, partial [Chloroflexota bacterium]|nr:hypothetical protein [Chloroflexota bacterium]